MPNLRQVLKLYGVIETVGADGRVTWVRDPKTDKPKIKSVKKTRKEAGI